MVMDHLKNNANIEAHENVIQGKILFQDIQLPKINFNQIKVLVVSNKNEFNNEHDMLLTETLPKLQQYFLTQSVYVNFIDCNLNWHLDISRNPYHILRYLNELNEAYQTSTGLFLLIFVGNRYGSIVLPTELSTADFNYIKNIATDLNKDVKLFERWYLLDDKLSPAVYKLRDPDEDFSNLLSRSSSIYDISVREDQEWNDVYTNLSDLFISVLHDKHNSKSRHDTSSLHDIQLYSGVETLFNYAAKISTTGCMCVIRQFEGLNEKSKGNEFFIDLNPNGNRLDKIRQEKLKRFRESITNKLSFNDNQYNLEENRIVLNLSWRDNGDFELNDTDYQRYIRTLNAAIFLRIKSSYEYQINASKINHLKHTDHILYNEVMQHFTYYRKLSTSTFVGFDHFLSKNIKFKSWFETANTSEHYPLMIVGNRASGKTLLCTKLVQYLLNTLGKQSQCIIRYFNLTSRSRSILDLFSLLCAQISQLKNVSTNENDLRNNKVQYYRTALESLSKSEKPIIIMIDGIEEAVPSSQHSSSVQYYQTLFQPVPAKVYVILSVSRPVHSGNNVDFRIRDLIEKMESNQSIIELPFTHETIQLNELTLYVKSELNSIKRNVTDSVLQALSKSIYDQMNEQTQMFFLLRLVLNPSYFSDLSQRKKKLDLSHLNLEQILNLYIDHCERKFGKKICSLLFNYISSSQSAINELELLDLLSSNNEFFLDYFPRDLPKILRFPPSLWIAIKYTLGPLLSEKYFDLKPVLCWSHSFIRRHMKQRYLKKVDDIRTAHRDIANYFLEAFIESKPLVDINRDAQIRGENGRRFILQQPLLYSETKYNYRRLNELWYQLMHSGDIDRLKEYTVCCFEYLLAKIHGVSIEQLLWEFDIVCSNILDADVLLVQTILKTINRIVSNDPVLLASELILRLRNIKCSYDEHIEALFVQSHEWSESCNIPVFVPLSSWIVTKPPLIITTIACTDGAYKIVPTTYNQHIFCTTRSNEIAMYHIPSKKLVKKFNGHTSTITSIEISNNSKYLVSASKDRTIKVFDLNSSESENTYRTQQDEILCMTISHNNEQIVTGSKNRLIAVIRLETGETDYLIEEHKDAITAIVLTQDDNMLLSASRDQTVKRWSFQDMQLIDTIETINSPITHMITTKDDIFIVLSCINSTVQVKSLITGSDVHNLEGHSSEVTSLAASNDSNYCFVGCTNSHIYVYDLRSRALLQTLTHHNSSINDICMSANDYFLFTASENSIYTLYIKTQFNEVLSQANPITALSISREGDVAIAGCASGAVQLYNLIDGEFTEHIIDHRTAVTQVELSHSYLFSLSGSKDTMVKVYDNEMGEIVTEFSEHSAPITYVRILEDNRKILSSDEQNHIKTWWANTGELIDSYHVACKMICVSPDGKYVVSGNGDHILKIWSLDDARVVRSIDHTEGKITCIAFRADSQYLITGGEDCSCKLWELASGKLTQVLVEHEHSITAVAISEDGKHVITGDKDGSVIIWSFKDGAVVHKLTKHKTNIVSVSFITDSSIAITASQDGYLVAWATITGVCLTAFHFNQTLNKLLTSHSGARYAAILQNTSCVAMLSLFNIPSIDSSKLSQGYTPMLSDSSNMLLPIKPKALLYPIDSTLISDCRFDSKTDQIPVDSSLHEIELLSDKYLIGN